jgi:hypothetical protein
MIPPRFVLEKSLAQIDAFLAELADASPLFTFVVEKMSGSKRFSQRAQDRWGRRIIEAIENQVNQLIEVWLACYRPSWHKQPRMKACGSCRMARRIMPSFCDTIPPLN